MASAFPVTHGGLGIALAKVAIAGRLGMDITIPSGMRPDYYLFSESLGRFVVTVAPDNKRAFEQIVGTDAILLGRVGGRSLRITAQKIVLDLPVERTRRTPTRHHSGGTDHGWVTLQDKTKPAATGDKNGSGRMIS